MRICIYCDTWGSGGIESFLLNVLEHIETCQFEIDLIVSRIESEFYAKRLASLGVTVRPLSNSTNRLFKNHKIFRQLLDARQYDVVYLNLFQALSLSYAKDAKKANVPLCIIHSHNNGLRKSVTRPLKLILHHIAKHLYVAYGDVRFACSGQAGKFMFPAYQSWTWIPNGIEVSKFAFNPSVRNQMRIELGVEGKLVLGNVGRLCDQKNQGFLIDLVFALSMERKDIMLLLIGDGEDREKLQQRIFELKLERYITLMGNCSDVSALYQAMDCFLFPSRFEGLGIVAVEAQAAGLPVLAAEGLPLEMQCSESLQFLPINQGIEPWVNALRVPLSRAQSTGFVAKKGYDIRSVSDVIECTWKKNLTKSKEAEK